MARGGRFGIKTGEDAGSSQTKACKVQFGSLGVEPEKKKPGRQRFFCWTLALMGDPFSFSFLGLN